MKKFLFAGQTCFIIIASFIIFFLLGVLIVKWWKEKITISEAISTGFIVSISIYELFAFPFIVKQGSLSVLTYLYFSVLIFLCIYSIWTIFRKKVQIEKKTINMIQIIGVIMVILIAFFAAYLYSNEADDSYYISVSTYAYEQDVVCLEQTEITTGMDYLSSTPKPQISAWEILLASWGKLFHIKPIILAHTVFPIIAIFLVFFVYRQIAEMLFENNVKDREWFILFFFFLVLFSGFSTANMGSFLLTRSWQGKSILVSVILPSLFVACYRMLSAKERKGSYWIYNGLILLAGTCCNPVGVYLGPLLYLMIALAYLSISNWDEIKQMLPGAIVSVIPVGLLALYSLNSIVTGDTGSYLKAEGNTWTDVLKEFWNLESWNSWIILVLFVMSLILFFKKNKGVLNVVFIGSAVLTIVFLLNPALYGIISQKITGVDVYWRLYWLLPIYVTLPYMCVYFKNKIIDLKFQMIAGMLICLMISVIGNNVFQLPEYFSAHRNLERIPSEIKKIADYLIVEDKGSAVMVPMNQCGYLRQYTSYLKTPYSRDLYNGSRELKSTSYNLEEFCKSVYYGNIQNPDVIVKTLKELEVDYIVMSKNDKLRETSQLSEIKQIEEYYIYKVIK